MYRKPLILFIILIISLLPACGAQEAVDTFDRAIATVEAGATAVASSETSDASDASEASDAPSTNPLAPAPDEANPSQNDAGSGGDAGDVTNPTPIGPGLGYSGQVGAGDLWDIYRVRSGPFEIVRVTVTADSGNSDALQFNLQNGAGDSSLQVEILPGSSITAVLAANQEQFNDLRLFAPGSSAVAYTFDVAVEPENDAGTGGDVTDQIGAAWPIALGQEISGTSVRLVGQGGHDRDCYAVELPGDSDLTVTLSSPAEQPYPDSYARVELYQANGDYIWGTSTAPGGSEQLQHTIETAGQYILCADTYEFYPIGYYRLTATTAP